MANKWFEETFLPSIETRMNNPKYPNQAIISEKQFEICVRNMKGEQHIDSDYRKAFMTYTYQIGKTIYMAYQQGRYYFLHRRQNVGTHYVRDLKNDVILATFETEEEYTRWYDENIDTETYTIKGTGLKKHQWTAGTF